LNLGGLEQQYGLPSGLLSAVMHQESGGNQGAVSPKGALGAFQFMPQTAKAYGINPLDPLQSAVGAARMMGDLSKQYGGDVPSMLAAYNWGSGNLNKHGLQNAPEETRNYIASIQGQLGKPVYEPLSNETTMSITPEMAKAELLRRQGITPEMAKAELARRSDSSNTSPSGKTSFLQDMGSNFQQGVQDVSDIANGSYADFGQTLPTPKTEALADKLLVGNTEPSMVGVAKSAFGNLGNTSASDWTGALLEKFGTTPEGKALGAITGLNPAWNAISTGVSKYINPAIEGATGIAPDNLQAMELAASPLGLRGAKTAKDPAVTIAKTSLQKMADNFGRKVENRPSAAEIKAQSLVKEAMSRDELTPESVAARLDQGKNSGVPLVALDVAEKNINGVPISGRNMQGLANAAANMPGKGATVAAQVAGRQLSKSQRIGGFLDEALGGKGLYKLQDEIQANIEQQANVARAKALASPKGIRSAELNDILRTNAGKSALGHAADLAKNEGVDLNIAKLDNDMSMTGFGTNLRAYDTQTLHYVKKALDDMAATGEGKGALPGTYNEKGRSLLRLRNRVNNIIKQSNPDYADWMTKFGDDASRLKASELGRDFLKYDPEEVTRSFNGFSKPEKEAYLVGVRRSVQDKITAAGDNADAVKRIWNEGTRQRLKPIMAPSDFRTLSKRMELERRAAATDARALGNSSTVTRQEYADKIRSGSEDTTKVLKAVTSPVSAAKDAVIDGVAKSLQKKMKKLDADTAHEIMKILYSDNPKDILKLVDEKQIKRVDLVRAVESIKEIKPEARAAARSLITPALTGAATVNRKSTKNP
jgi:hypothetical protein